MRKLIFIILAFIISYPAVSQAPARITFSEGVFDKNTSWSIYVANAATGEVIADKDGDLNLIPASIMKLIPTATALSLLGEDYRFTTSLAFTGSIDTIKKELNGNIIIIGGGDPMLGSSYFSNSYGDVIGKWVKAISNAGIRSVNGDIIADASIYDYQPDEGGWEWEDIGVDYGAGIHGLNFNDNVFSIHVKSNDISSKPVIDSIDQTGTGINIINNLSAKGSKDNSYIFSAPYTSSVTLEGMIPPSQKGLVLKAALPDPPLTIASVLKKRLVSDGISVSGCADTKRTKVTNDSVMEMLVTTVSPDLKEMITVTNNHSVNLYAAQLCKHLGRVYRNEGSFNAGMEVIRDFLKKAGCEPETMNLTDPAGLSRNNTLSTSSMVRFLSYIYNTPEKESFISSLPVGGVSGTIKNTFHNDVFRNRIKAKTGSMTGVKSLAGYVETKKGQELAFAIIVNGFTSTNGEIQQKMEEILKGIILNY